MISAIAIRQTPFDVQLAVFQLHLRTLSSIGVAVGQGGPDFWYSSMRGRPVRLLRCTGSSHHQDCRRTDSRRPAMNRPQEVSHPPFNEKNF